MLEVPAPAAPAPGIVRRRSGSGHAYKIDGVKVPGVTRITGHFVTGGLTEYPATATRNYAVNHWEELNAMLPADRIKALTDGRWADVRAGALRGTEVHRIAEALNAGQEAAYADEHAGYVDAYRDFLDRAEPKVIAAELVVGNRTHRYCGTLDLIADLGPVPWDGTILPPARWLLDLKTSRSGIFAETALQVCAYEHAEVFVAEDGDERPMALFDPPITRCGGVHVRADGWDLIPLDTGPDTWAYFQFLAWLYHMDEARKEWVGPAAGPWPDAGPAAPDDDPMLF